MNPAMHRIYLTALERKSWMERLHKTLFIILVIKRLNFEGFGVYRS